MMAKKIILTGCNGQDGSYMIEYLLENTKDTIIAAMRRTSQDITNNLKSILDNPRVKFVTMDLNDAHSIDNLIKIEQPDYFINLGAQTFVADSWASPESHMQTNAIALIHILESIRKHVPFCRVYSAGSSEQWGNVKYSPQDEKHPMSPRSIYGVSKCTASFICKVYRESYGIYVVHGVLFNHESERRQKYFVSRKITDGVARIYHAIKDEKEFEPIELGNLMAKRDFSHAQDFIDGIWRMLNQERYNPNLGSLCALSSSEQCHKNIVPYIQEYVLSSDETHTIQEFVELAFAEAGFEGCFWAKEEPITEKGGDEYCWINKKKNTGHQLVRVNPKFYRPAEVELLWGNSSAARRDLDWKPKISFKELVSRMVKWDISNYEK